MRPVFNVPGEGAFPLIMGIISGYPIGAKIVADFRKNNICTKEECERLLSFTNNSGPLFIIGTVGLSLIGDKNIGIILLIIHIISSLIVGIIFKFWKTNKSYKKYRYEYQINNKLSLSFSNLGEILTKSITNSINTVVMIGGFVILFSVIISILENSQIFKILSQISSPLLNLLNIPITFSDAIFSRNYRNYKWIKNSFLYTY